MSIRQQAEFDGKNWHGYIEFGGNVDEKLSEVKEELPLAKEVLVFMLVAGNAYFKLPVGYFLANGLNSEQRVGLVNKCLILCEDNVVTLTFDCTSANFSMATKLGANIQNG